MKPTYESPLASRYASKTMLHLFSPDMRYETWRRLWVALARAEHTLGLPITQAQVDELAAHVSPIDYDVVAAREKEVRHDVMAHIYAYVLFIIYMTPVVMIVLFAFQNYPAIRSKTLSMDQFTLINFFGQQDYEFLTVSHAVNDFCVVTLSSLYLDIIKDRLYCDGADSAARRSAQSALWIILDAMTTAATCC